MSTMQPPPRKGNYTKFLKNLHSEQIAKLQLKNQHECDLLEDIRSYIIKKSSIEKSYSEALLRISSAYVNKKAPNIPDIKLEGGEEKWNMWNVWRLVLEENEKLARARLAAIEVFQQQIADEAKVLRAQKLQTARKCTDQLAIVQKELQLCVQDVDKNKKIYYDEEHSAHDVRDKAKDIEEKLKKKKGSFFQSITSLQKNSAKFSSKREQLEEKSTGARNDYLLSLAAANAHQNRYFAVDLQMTMSIMENNVFDKVTEFLTLMGRTELLTCSATQNSYGKIRDQASQMTREYNLKCCYLYYPVLKQHIQYDYEPCDNDPIDHVTADHDSAAATLSREAKRWATRIARENNNIKESVRRLQIYNALRESGQRVDPNDPNGQDLETKIDDLKQSIRRSETAKMKAEARIECLRAGGVNVDEWVQEVETLSVQDIPRSASSLSVRTDGSAPGEQPSSDSFYDSEGEQQTPVQQQPEQHPQPEKEDSEEQDDTQEVDAMLEQERQRIEQLTAGWDDPTQVDWGAEEHTEAESATEAQNLPPPAPGLKCTALYSYTAQNPDELSIVENEQLEVVGEGDGDGWLRARNYRGEEGFVPQNYLDVERDAAQQAPGALASQISFSSVDYTVDEQDDADGFPGPGEISGEQTDQTQSPEQVSVISAQQRESDAGEPSSYCCALYDYDAGGADELSFEEGQIIRVINKCAHGVDDGWWEGELEGRIGNFPSLVVEECDENGEPLTNQWDETPPPSAPPVFTPPEIPNFMLQPAEVIITQATPMLEHAQQSGSGDLPNGNAPPPTNPPNPSETQQNGSGGFSMSLSKNQHKQYQENVKKTDIPCVMIEDESGHQEPGDGENGGGDGDDDADFGLGVAQIVITAATPMMEEPEHGFPSVPEEKTNNGTTDDEITSVDEPTESDQKTVEEVKSELEKIEKARSADVADEVEEKSTADDLPTDSAPFPTSSSSASDAGSTGPSTAENSQSCPAMPSGGGGAMATRIDDDVLPDDEMPKQVVGGRASIPDELEPHQLAQLQDLKESNA